MTVDNRSGMSQLAYEVCFEYIGCAIEMNQMQLFLTVNSPTRVARSKLLPDLPAISSTSHITTVHQLLH